MCKVKDYIENTLVFLGYDSFVTTPSIEQLLMLKQLCELEINKYFEEN